MPQSLNPYSFSQRLCFPRISMSFFYTEPEDTSLESIDDTPTVSQTTACLFGCLKTHCFSQENMTQGLPLNIVLDNCLCENPTDYGGTHEHFNHEIAYIGKRTMAGTKLEDTYDSSIDRKPLFCSFLLSKPS